MIPRRRLAALVLASLLPVAAAGATLDPRELPAVAERWSRELPVAAGPLHIHAAALLIVDMQEEMVGARGRLLVWGGPAIVPAVASLEAAFRRAGRPVLFSKQVAQPGEPCAWWAPHAFEIGQPGSEIVGPLVPAPGEEVVQKDRSSAFAHTRLGKSLAAAGVHQIVVVGVTTDACVAATVHDAVALGLRAIVPIDATGSLDETTHLKALRQLSRDATLVRTRDVVAALEPAAGASRPGSSSRFALEGGRVLGRDLVARDATIHVEGRRIVAVDDRAASSGETRIDLAGATVIPAFMDSHVHLTFADPREIARGGVGTALDLGARQEFLDDLTRARPLRLLAAGPMLTTPGGYPVASDWGRDGFGRELRSPGEGRAAVRDLVARGARAIKVALAPEHGPALTAAEAAAIVDEAHRAGLRVAAEAVSAAGFALALDAGVDVLAHSPVERIDDALLARFAARPSAAVIPTLRGYLLDPDALENFRRLRAAGCRVLYGTDTGNLASDMLGLRRQPGIDVKELQLYLAAGMTNAEILASATREPCDYFGVPEAGVLEAGRDASLLALRADPRERLSALDDRCLVMIGGEILSGPACAAPAKDGL